MRSAASRSVRLPAERGKIWGRCDPMNKVWFITGAGHGFGAAVARAALDAGDEVFATARERSRVERGLGTSARLLAMGLDVTRRNAPQLAVDLALARFGRIDVVVHNAGCTPLDVRECCSELQAMQLVDVHAIGLLAVIRAVLPALRGRIGARIFNLCSTPVGLSVGLAAELAPLGVELTTLEPGPPHLSRARELVASIVAGEDRASKLTRENRRRARSHAPLKSRALGA